MKQDLSDVRVLCAWIALKCRVQRAHRAAFNLDRYRPAMSLVIEVFPDLLTPWTFRF